MDCSLSELEGGTAGWEREGIIIIWDISTGRELQLLKTNYFSNVKSLAFSNDGKRLVSGSSDGSIIVWDLDW